MSKGILGFDHAIVATTAAVGARNAVVAFCVAIDAAVLEPTWQRAGEAVRCHALYRERTLLGVEMRNFGWNRATELVPKQVDPILEPTQSSKLARDRAADLGVVNGERLLEMLQVAERRRYGTSDVVSREVQIANVFQHANRIGDRADHVV